MIEKLRQRASTFPERLTRGEKEALARLAKGQSPPFMLITCSDSRILPGRLLEPDFGELFVFRNMGNIIPPIEVEKKHHTGVGAFLEYGAGKLGAKHLIIMGHTDCGAVKGFLNPPRESNGFVPAYLRIGEETRRILSEKLPSLSPEEQVLEGVRTNILVQVRRVLEYPVIKEKGVRIHAWLYHIDSGRVEVLEER